MKISSRYAIALTAALGLFMAVLDNTVVNVALTPMATSLNTTLSSIEWVVTGYFLAQAAVIPVAGYFSTRVGIKRLFILCLGLFTLGSLACGLSHTEGLLIGFRVLQGLGGGALFPLAQSIAFGAFPPQDRAAVSAVVGIPVLLAPAFGPTIGGLLTTTLGWEYIFFINIPVGILAIALAWRIIPADKPATQAARSFDYVGLALSILGVLAVVYAFTLVSQPQPGTETPFNPRGTLYGWGYWPVWALLGLGIVILIGFALYELRVSRDPVLDLRLYKRRDFALGSLVIWVTAMVIFGSLILIPIFLEQVRLPHLTALDAGFALMPQGIAAAVAVGLSGRLYNTLGVRTLLLVGGLLLVLSSWQLTTLSPTSDGLTMLPWLIVRGLGFGFTNIPVQTLALQQITGPDLPRASSLFTVTRQIFSSIGVAVVTTLFVQQTTAHAGTLQAALTQSLPAGTRPDPASPAFQAARDHLLAQAGTSGVNDVFVLVTIGTLLVVLLALFMPGRVRTAQAPGAVDAARAPDQDHAVGHPILE